MTIIQYKCKLHIKLAGKNILCSKSLKIEDNNYVQSELNRQQCKVLVAYKINKKM